MKLVAIPIPRDLDRRIRAHAASLELKPSELMSLWIAKAEQEHRAKLKVNEIAKNDPHGRLCPKCQELQSDDWFWQWCPDCSVVGRLSDDVALMIAGDACLPITLPVLPPTHDTPHCNQGEVHGERSE